MLIIKPVHCVPVVVLLWSVSEQLEVIYLCFLVKHETFTPSAPLKSKPTSTCPATIKSLPQTEPQTDRQTTCRLSLKVLSVKWTPPLECYSAAWRHEAVLWRPSLRCSKWATVNSPVPVGPWGASQGNPIIFGVRQRSNWQQLLRQQTWQKRSERGMFTISTWQHSKLPSTWSHLLCSRNNTLFRSNRTNSLNYANSSLKFSTALFQRQTQGQCVRAVCSWIVEMTFARVKSSFISGLLYVLWNSSDLLVHVFSWHLMSRGQIRPDMVHMGCDSHARLICTVTCFYNPFHIVKIGYLCYV